MKSPVGTTELPLPNPKDPRLLTVSYSTWSSVLDHVRYLEDEIKHKDGLIAAQRVLLDANKRLMPK